MFTGKKSAQIREILISESAWEEMTCLFAPSLMKVPCLNIELRHTIHVTYRLIIVNYGNNWPYNIKALYAQLLF